MNIFIFICGVLCCLSWWFVAQISFGLPDNICRWLDALTFNRFSIEISKMRNGFHYDVDNSDMPTLIFFVIYFLIFFLLCWIIIRIKKDNPLSKTFLIQVIVFSCLFRIIMLPSIAIHENDFYRYLWDGKSAKHQINPFKYSPLEVSEYEEYVENMDYFDMDDMSYSKSDTTRLDKLVELRDQQFVHFSRIGHKEVPTIYPPMAQAVFYLSSFILEDSILFMKFIFILFDLGAIWLIILLLRHFKMNPAMSVMYGWSPLVIKEFANSGHYDTLPIFFTLLFLYLYIKKKIKTSAVVLSLAALCKFFSGVLLPVFFLR